MLISPARATGGTYEHVLVILWGGGGGGRVQDHLRNL